MKFQSSLLIFLCACEGAISLQTEPADIDSEEEVISQGDTAVDASDDDFVGDEDEIVVETGTWNLDTAQLLDDPCQWDAPLVDFFGVGSDALLPQSFDVEGSDGSFQIEAVSYGASGPINCSIDRTNFSCETQNVVPVDYDLGEYGWEYAIDFSGSLNNEGSLVGTAKVTFPEVSEYVVGIFEYLGTDPFSCSMTYELAISY